MTFQKYIKWMIPPCLLVVSACNHQPASEITLVIQPVYSSNVCALDEPVLKRITSQAEFNQLLQSMPKNFGMHEMFEPEINFEKEMLILYGIGKKPSSGYSINLYKSDAVLKDNKLYLPIQIKSPASGSVQAQMISSPCKVFLLPLVDYSEIVIESGLDK